MTCSNNTHTCCGGYFNPHSVVPTKQLTEYLVFAQTLSQTGSIFLRSVVSNLGITQSFSDFTHVVVSQSLSVSDVAVGPVDRPRSLTSTMVIVDAFTAAGTAPGGDGGQTDITAIFDSTTSAGAPVYVSGDGHVDLARSLSSPETIAIGLAIEAVAASSSGRYISEGQLTLSDWTDVSGTATLTVGGIYYLSPAAAGKLTLLSPTDGGEYVVRVCQAISEDTVDIEVSRPILLSGSALPPA